MKITYDKTADAQYIYLKRGRITHTKKATDWLLFDCAKNGDILGVEILNISQNIQKFAKLGKKISLSTVK